MAKSYRGAPKMKRVIKKIRKDANALRRDAVRANATTRPQRQGVATYTQRPFGCTSNGALSRQHIRRYLNAMHPLHLPLPRAVGPYSVVRTTQVFTVSDETSFWGPMRFPSTNLTSPQWTTVVGVSGVDPLQPLNAAANARAYNMVPLTSNGWDNCHVTPAAFTIQVMNGAPVAAGAGVARIGRIRTMLDPDKARDWFLVGEDTAAYNFPRLCSGGKLSLRGVQCSAVPFNMADLADFSSIRDPGSLAPNFTFTWNSNYSFEGFAPIMLLQSPDMAAQAAMSVLVTVEWRVRFDPNNPAQGSHVQHKVADDSLWGEVCAGAEATAHGVEDIVEDVADAGTLAAAGRIGAAVMF